MEYFRKPIEPDSDRNQHNDQQDYDPDHEFLAGANFGETRRSRFRLPRVRRTPSALTFSSRPPDSSNLSLLPRLGRDKKVLVAFVTISILIVGSVAGFALSGGSRTVAGDLPPSSTITTFPPFPTASVMPPPDAGEQPDGGVIRAPELTDDEDVDPGSDEDDGAVAAPEAEQPDAAAPAASPSEQQDRDESPGAESGRAAGSTTAPVRGYVTSATYGQAGNWSTGHHTGVDLAVPVGTPVVAVRAGLVLMSATDASYGHYVLIRHDEHEFTLYAHLSQGRVEQGATVAAGQQIGASGATGNVTGPHLHFEVRTEPIFGSDIDPVAYLASHGVRL
ncbi:M23 family metallopeptidase [Streptomyces sp. NPDC002755]|uniref:M23 family metallopeptidase n=1 Tax=Streptomyces sp. NPDC002884 TaxID=3154544 RepID=UPI00332D78E5